MWYLAVIRHDFFLEKASRPQRRTVSRPPFRGTIHDRFDIPLAINKVQYNVAVCYDRIRDMPSVRSYKDPHGNKVKRYERRRYVEDLARFLGEVLDTEPVTIRDTIHAKAAIFPNTPFVIKEDVPETVYYRLRALERDWVGLTTQRLTKRFYPQGRTASSVIGYIGMIDRARYSAVTREAERLALFLERREAGFVPVLPEGFGSVEEVRCRLQELKTKEYTARTRVGRMGAERSFDEILRGVRGKEEVEVEATGRIVRRLAGEKKPVSGTRVRLALSSELQAYAEKLLLRSEREREDRFSSAPKGRDAIVPPWIRGGAIVALLPDTGEVVALASHPRFDPNDFSGGREDAIRKWLELPSEAARMWDGKVSLRRENITKEGEEVYEERIPLLWSTYLDLALPFSENVRKALERIETVGTALRLMRSFSPLAEEAGTENLTSLLSIVYPEEESHQTDLPLSPERIARIKKEGEPYLSSITHHEDRVLLFDLLRLIIDETRFPDPLPAEVGSDPLALHRRLSQAYAVITERVREEALRIYEKRLFPLWRQKHFTSFLKAKRGEERTKKSYERPYTDYLHQAQKGLFSTFWQENGKILVHAFLLRQIPDHPVLRSFAFHLCMARERGEREHDPVREDLNLLTARLRRLPRNVREVYLRSMRTYADLNPRLQSLARAFYPKEGFGFGRSYAFGTGAILGSLFKPVVGYEALKQTALRHECAGTGSKDLNPLSLYDETRHEHVPGRGTVLGYKRQGEKITRRYKGGRLPKSHAPLGFIDFFSAMERSSNLYFSLLAGDVIDHPSHLYETARAFGFGKPTGIDLIGEVGGHLPDDIRDDKTGLYALAIGQHSLIVTPLQTAVMFATMANGGKVLKPQIALSDTPSVKTVLPMPDAVYEKLMYGMHRVIWGEKGSAGPHRIRSLAGHPERITAYKRLRGRFVGKTSTAERTYRPATGHREERVACKEIWFGGIGFKGEGPVEFDPKTAVPEIVVVVYLRFGDYGKEAAPIAAEIIRQWHRITHRPPSGSHHASPSPERVAERIPRNVPPAHTRHPDLPGFRR